MKHRIVVKDIGTKEDDEYKLYHIFHPKTCLQLIDNYDHQYYAHNCDIAFELDNCGSLKFTLKYSGTPITKPGFYYIDTWHETIRGFDYTEYDGGIYVINYEQHQNNNN